MSARWCVAVLGGLVVVLLFTGLGSMALTDRDEGANAEAAREMLEQRSWVTPTLIYAPRFAKPPLVYWLMAAGYERLGVSETTARLPSAVAAAVLVFLQYALARWAYGPVVAFRAALILLLSVEFVALARMALTDSVLVLWTSAAGFAFLRAYHDDGRSRGRWYAAMYTALALAMLAKGPVGVLVPGAAIPLYLTLVGGWRRLWRDAKAAWGLALFLLIASPWYAAMFWQHGGDYLARAKGETLGRVFRAVTGPGGTVLFYVPVVLIGFFPWSALLPGTLVAALRGARARAAASRADSVTVFAAAWVVAVLVLFSLVQSRLPHYIAPIFPPAALLLAATWPSRVPVLARGILAVLGAGLGALLLAAGTMGPTLVRLLAPAYPADPAAALPRAAFAVGALALAVGAAALVRDGARLFAVLVGLMAGLLGVGLHAVLPGFSAQFVAPAGDLARHAARIAKPCDDLVGFGPYRPSLVFYARRPVAFVDAPDRSRLAGIASRPGRLLLVTPRSMLWTLPPGIAALPPLDARGGYLLLATAPGDAGCTDTPPETR